MAGKHIGNGGLCENLFGGASSNEPAVADHEDLIAKVGDFRQVVVHQQDGHAVVAQFLEYIHDGALTCGINTSEGLVQDDEFRIANERARQQHALALPTR